MNGAKIYHSKFGILETIKWRHILFPGLYASIQATAIVQFQLKLLNLLRSSNYDFVKTPVESNLSVYSIIVTTRPNCFRGTYCVVYYFVFGFRFLDFFK